MSRFQPKADQPEAEANRQLARNDVAILLRISEPGRAEKIQG